MKEKILNGTMEYKGFTAQFKWVEEAGLYDGEVADTWGVVGFHAGTLEEAEQGFREALDWYLEICERDDQEPRLSNRETMAHAL
jgi:predicted HicB family RNase H-like nuclease